MDQIQEKKTTKSTFRNISKNVSFIPSMSHLQKPMITTTKHKYEARKL